MSPTHVDAYVLHQRPYRETSAIVDFITEDDHHIRAVCKGIRGTGKQAIQRRGSLQPFIRLSILFSGRTDLKSLQSVESTSKNHHFSGRALYAGIYINELVVRLCSFEGVASGLYTNYSQTLQSLSHLTSQPDVAELEKILRLFEFSLLNAVGYGYDWRVDGLSGQVVDANAFYRLDADNGFVKTINSNAKGKASTDTIPGNVLLAIGAGEFADEGVSTYAKLIARQSLRSLLGEKPLKSRELYR